MTNEEKIKNMSTEELARFLWGNGIDCNCCIFQFCSDECRHNSCVKEIAEWLKAEEKE